MRHEPTAPRLSGKSRSASSAAFWTSARMARLDSDGVVERIDRADAVEPREAHDDAVAVLPWHAGAIEAGIAALRHDRQACGCAERNNRRDLRRRGWAHNHARRAAIEAAPFAQ